MLSPDFSLLRFNGHTRTIRHNINWFVILGLHFPWFHFPRDLLDIQRWRESAVAGLFLIHECGGGAMCVRGERSCAQHSAFPPKIRHIEGVWLCHSRWLLWSNVQISFPITMIQFEYRIRIYYYPEKRASNSITNSHIHSLYKKLVANMTKVNYIVLVMRVKWIGSATNE